MTKGSSVRTILVIDEDQNALDAARAMLEPAGYRVLTRDRSAGSISAIVKEKPDVVLVELNMVRLNGETISKIINKTVPRPAVCVLFYSSLPVETLRLKALASGAQGYVQKTETAGELVRRIEHCVANASLPSKGRLQAVAQFPKEVDAGNERDRDPPSTPRRMNESPQPISPATTLRREAQSSNGKTSALKALFVDDDWSLLRAYRSALGSELQAEFLTSGEEAISRVLSDSPPDIIVCDIIMPFVTGADLYTRAVKVDPSWKERFLFLTGASSTRVVIDFLNEHEGRVLFKPVPSNRLLDTIRKMDSSAPPIAPR
jgi:DNA-binding response OmpR family regulator